MKYASVCSGIEAATVAWHELGWEPAWFAEIDRFPSALLTERFPSVPNLGDMTQIEPSEHGPIDLLVGGTPCQSFSVAGLRAGLADPRGNLALEFLRLVDAARPRWVVWENVPGVLSSSGGRDFGTFLGGLGELGYGFAYRVLDAQYFGVPQRRRRVFVVGCAGDWRAAAAVLLERESLLGNPPPSREEGAQAPAGSRDGLARGLTSRPTGRQDISTETLIAEAQAFDARQSDVIQYGAKAGPIDTDGHSQAVFAIQERATAENPATGPDGSGFRSDGAAYTLEARSTPQAVCFGPNQVTNPENRSNPLPGSPCHTLPAKSNSPILAFMAGQGAKAGGLGIGEEVSPTPKSSPSGLNTSPTVAVGAGVRRLTPRECERLQGFPDDWTLIPWRGKEPRDCPDSPRYKAIGNSMAVPVMRWIGERVDQVEAHLA